LNNTLPADATREALSHKVWRILVTRFVQNQCSLILPDFYYSISVTNGKNAMPAFGGRLSDDDIKDVAAYVISQSEAGWDGALKK
jgi:hypothetical protein